MSQINNQPRTCSEEGRSVIEIIRDIKATSLDPKSLSPEDRRACVMHLSTEGLTVPEIAQVLKVSDRTIARDRKAIQESNAIWHDPHLAGQFAGRVVAEADACIARIRRATRDKGAPHAVKVEGERACFEIVNKATLCLQSLGYLPSAAQQIKADLTHHLGEPLSIKAIQTEAKRLEQIECEIVDSEAKPEADPQTMPLRPNQKGNLNDLYKQ